MKYKWINRIHQGDVIEVLKQMPDEFVDMVVTSPPYWGLRNYNVEGQIGQESNPQDYISKMIDVCREVKRVLKKSGSFYLNIGDTYFGNSSYSSGGGQGRLERDYIQDRGKGDGKWLQPKQLMLMPSRVAIALQDDGWILRNDIIWHKVNPIPSSVKDRLSNTYEHVFFFVKQRKHYYYDLDAIGVPYKTHENRPFGIVRNREYNYDSKMNILRSWGVDKKLDYHGEGKKNPKGQSPSDLKRNIIDSFKKAPIVGKKNPGDVLSPKYSKGAGHSDRQGLNRELDIVTIKAYKEYQEPIAKYLKSNIRPYHKPKLDETFGKHKWTHWIRTDLSGASLPGAEDWFKLKEIIGFDNTFDDKIYEVQKLNIPIFQSGRNPGDFLSIPNEPFSDAHFACFPKKLVSNPIKSSCPKFVCKKCGAPKKRVVHIEGKSSYEFTKDQDKSRFLSEQGQKQNMRAPREAYFRPRRTVGWEPTCDCKAEFESGIVMDIFAGSGTACLVAKQLGRRYIGIELNPEYIKMARKRLSESASIYDWLGSGTTSVDNIEV